MRGRLVQPDIEVGVENGRRVVVEDVENLEEDSYIEFRKN